MHQWCADRYEHYPVTPEDMNSYYERYIKGQHSCAMTMIDGDEIVGYITLRTPADDTTEQRLGFVIVDDSKRGRGLGKKLVTMAVKYAFEELGAEKCHSESLKIIRQPFIAMKRRDSIAFQDRRQKAINVWAKRGTASKWNYYHEPKES